MKDTNKLPDIMSLRGLALLMGLAVLMLLLAVVIVPVISSRTGISDIIISLTGAALCFVIALGSMALHRLKANKDKKNG